MFRQDLSAYEDYSPKRIAHHPTDMRTVSSPSNSYVHCKLPRGAEANLSMNDCKQHTCSDRTLVLLKTTEASQEDCSRFNRYAHCKLPCEDSWTRTSLYLYCTLPSETNLPMDHCKLNAMRFTTPYLWALLTLFSNFEITRHHRGPSIWATLHLKKLLNKAVTTSNTAERISRMQKCTVHSRS